MKRINTYDPRKDKEVFAGVYESNTGTFVKTVTKRHYMIKEKGYGIQIDVIDYLKNCGCKEIKIKTKKETYSVDFDRWVNQGKLKNYGHGLQIFFPVRFMNKEGK